MHLQHVQHLQHLPHLLGSRRRHIVAAPTSSSITSAVTDGTENLVLTFDTPINLVGDPSTGAFTIEGLVVISASKTAADQITIVFNDVVDAGLIWNLSSGEWVSPHCTGPSSGETV